MRGVFYARVQLSGDEIVLLETWDEALTLTPTDGARLVKDWGLEHLQDWDVATFRERLAIVCNDMNVEVVFKAAIEGFGPDHTGEYDESVDILGRLTQVLPDDWFDGPPNSLIPTIFPTHIEHHNHEHPDIPCTVTEQNGFVLVSFTGYVPGGLIQGECVAFEVGDDGHPRVLVWSDTENESPTHAISLANARREP